MLAWLLRGLGLALLFFLIGPERRERARVLWDRFWNVSAVLVVLFLTISIAVFVLQLVLERFG